MSIQEVTGASSPVPPPKKGKAEKDERPAAAPSDKVQVSAEARSMYEMEQSGRADAIRQKLDSGFYSGKEVTEKIVDGLLEDLKKSA